MIINIVKPRYATSKITSSMISSLYNHKISSRIIHIISQAKSKKNMHHICQSTISVVIAQLLCGLAMAANQPPKIDGQNIVISMDKPALLQSIKIDDDSNAKVKAIIEVPEGYEISASSSSNVTVNQRSKQKVEFEGSTKHINSFLSSKKSTPVIKSTSEKIENGIVKIIVEDAGNGISKSGFISLPDIGGNAGINRAPDGWQLNTHTPDIISGNGPWPGGNYEITDIDGGPSPFGGNIGLFLERADGSTPAESWKTKISGLTKSEKYTLRFAWQQSTVKKNDGTGAKYSGGQLLVTVDGKEHTFSPAGSVSNDGWQTAEVEFTAQSSSVEISVGVKSNTSNTDGESIVVDTGNVTLTTLGEVAITAVPSSSADTKLVSNKSDAIVKSEAKSSDIKITEKQASDKTFTKKVKSIESAPKVPSDKIETANSATSSINSNATVAMVSSGRITSLTGSIPEPTIDIIPSTVNTTNVGEVAITGTCISGATVSLSCYSNKATNQTLSPPPSTTCSTSNAYSMTVNLSSLADDTVSCVAQQTIGSDSSSQSTKDVVTKTTANMSVANVISLEAPIVGLSYKQSVICTNNGISTAENAYCSVSGLPSWASTNCSSTTTNLKPGDSIRCDISGIPNSALPINANTSTGATNDDVASNNSGKLSSSLGTLPTPNLDKLASNINAKEASKMMISGSCVPNATVSFSCSSNHASYNQLSTIPTVSCNSEGKFSSHINVNSISDGTIACSASQTLGNVISASSNVSTSVKSTAKMTVPSSISLAAPVVGSPYNQSISCTNNGSSAATNAFCSISGLPSWANTTCAPTPPTLVPVGGSIVCKITGIPTSATPISATISTGASNNER